jgi:hypothetical protein
LSARRFAPCQPASPRRAPLSARNNGYVGAGFTLLQSLVRAGELVLKGYWLKARAEGPKRAESGGRNVLTSEGRRPERADQLAQPPACGAAPAAPRPGSSEVEQPPCKRPVGGSNPFPGSPWKSLQSFSSVEKSVAFATIFGRSAQSAAGAWPGVCPSGQREQTVNLPASPTEVRILPPPHRRNMPL